MSDLDMSPAETLEMFGGEAQPIMVDVQELEVGLALQSIRVQLVGAAAEAKVGTVQLANRLDIAPSAVSRFMGGEGDMKVSTAVLYARALGHRWGFFLARDELCTARGNRRGRIEASLGIVGTGTMTSGSTQMMSIMESTCDRHVQIEPKIKAFA